MLFSPRDRGSRIRGSENMVAAGLLLLLRSARRRACFPDLFGDSAQPLMIHYLTESTNSWMLGL